MIRALGDGLSRLCGRWLPEPFTIALTLTLATFGLAWITTGVDPLTLIGLWGGRLDVHGKLTAGEAGIWRLLAFAMQMCLILVTGYALASTRPVRRGIHWLAERPGTPAGAVALTAVVAMLAGWINWGLGLIVGALLAREVGYAASRRSIPVHYPLIGAAGYTGMMVWHGGLSGTAPFKITQRADLAELLGQAGDQVSPIPLTDTIFSPLNFVVLGALLIAVPLLLIKMLPADPERRQPCTLPPAEEDQDARSDREAGAPADRLERSPIIGWLFGGIILIYLVSYLGKLGVAKADLNAINLLFLGLGLMLHGSPRAYGEAVAQAASGCAGIILQFPFYAGIMGVMAASGLMALLAEAVVSIASPGTFAPLTFLAAGAINLFVPSGGGQWAVQGPVLVQAADALQVSLPTSVMAFAYGDAWTNMLQPFWALPLLAITGLKARQLIGYTAATMLLTAPIYLIALSLMG